MMARVINGASPILTFRKGEIAMTRRTLYVAFFLILLLARGTAHSDNDIRYFLTLPPGGPPLLTTTTDSQGYTLWKTEGNPSCEYADHELTINVDVAPEEITDSSLIVSAYDVDYTGDPACAGGPEVDTVTLNGTNLGILRGANDSWSTTRFSVNPGILRQGDNTVHIDTDSTSTGCWCVGIGYVALRGKVGNFQVKSVTPQNKAECVDWENPGIAAKFSAEVDPATVTSSTFTVTARYGTTTYSGNLSIDGSTINFTPNPTLPDRGIEIKVTIKGGQNGVKAKSGAQLPADYTWTFMTMPKIKVEIIPEQVVEGVNLVHNKSAVVRVRATWDDFSDVVKLPAKVSITYDSSETFTKEKFFYYIDLPLKSIPNDYKKHGKSANFYSSRGEVPIIATPGSHTIHAVVEPAGQTATTPKTFEADASVSVNQFWIGYTSQTVNFRTRYVPLSLGGWTAGSTQDITNLATGSDNFLRKVYPLAKTTPRIDTTVMDISEPWVLKVKRILKNLAATNRLGPYNVVVGVVPASWLSAQVGAVGVQANFVAGITTYAALIADTAGSVIAPHEIGHVFGLEHDPATYSLLGYDLSRDTAVDNSVSKIYSFSVMDENIAGVGETTVWITKSAYQELLGELTSRAQKHRRDTREALVLSGNASGTVVYVSGEISIAGGSESASVDSIDILSANAEIATGGSGTHSIELQNSSGTALSTITFTPEFETAEDGNKYAPFVAGLPYETSGEKIVIKHGATNLKTITRSAHDPVVSIVSPSSGQSVSGSVNVSWSASDADGDTLTFSLLYSADGGNTWDLIAPGLTSTTYNLNTAALPNNAQSKIKVIANDGFNTVEAVSGSFTTANPCSVLATVPANGATAVPVDQQIIVRFRDAMDRSSITTTAITLQDAVGNIVKGTVLYDNETLEATLNPSSNLKPLSAYTIRVATSVKNVAGAFLGAEYNASFTTAADSSEPSIAVASPPDGSDGAPINTLVCVTFDEAMDPASISNDTFKVSSSDGSSAAGTVSYDASTQTACFTPSSNLSALTQYAATVSSQVKDAAGNALGADFKWSFKTGSETSSGLRLTGNYDDSVEDLDGDGLWDKLTITVGVEVLSSSSFNLNGRLIDSNGEEISWATTENTSLGAGVHTLCLSFTSDDIRSHGVNGPYTLADLQFYDVYDTSRYVWESEAYNTYPYNVLKFNATLTLTGLPDIYLLPGQTKDNAFNLNDFANHKTLSDAQLTYEIEINTDPRSGVSIDSGNFIDINPQAEWLGYSDVTVKATGGGFTARDTFRVTVSETPVTTTTTTIPGSSTTTTTASSECTEDYPIDCGNGYCCPEDYPYCGTGLRRGKCFSEEPSTPCPASQLFGEQSPETSLLREFRDSVLMESAEGRLLIEAYYRNADEITTIIKNNTSIRKKLTQAILNLLPPVNKALVGFSFTIDEKTVRLLQELGQEVSVLASDRLKHDIQTFMLMLSRRELLPAREGKVVRRLETEGIKKQ